MLMKVKATQKNRSEIIQITDVFEAKIVHVEPRSIIIEITGKESKLDSFLRLMQPFGIKEVVRSGVMAISRQIEVSA